MKVMKFVFSLFVCLMLANGLQAKDCNILDFGAKPDGTTMNTKAIQSAIDYLSKTGGGTLIVPKGRFLTGSIELKSNINLYLDKDAVLLGSTEYADYRKLTDHMSLILASDQSHISISGEGSIDGQGRAMALKLDSLFFVGKMNRDDYDLTRPDERVRPTDLQIVNCKDVMVKQVTFKNAACWVQQYIGCENVVIDKIRVDSEAFSNNDGMDIANCKNVSITGCVVNSADDGICLKGSWNDQILIQNCRIRSSASAIKFGSGVGATNVTIKDIYIYDTYRSALALESVDGNAIENILVDGLHVSNTWNVFYLRIGKRNLNSKGEVGTLKNITIRNVSADVPYARPDIYHETRFPGLSYPLNANIYPAMIIGVTDRAVENVHFENVSITYPGRGDEGTAYMPVWKMKNIPENEKVYPEFNLHGEMPAWGFYVRHAKGISFKNVAVAAKKHDYRPAFVFDDVQGINMERVYINEDDNGPQIILRNVSGENLKENQDQIEVVQ